jgi:hypothetical protein
MEMATPDRKAIQSKMKEASTTVVKNFLQKFRE